MVYTYNVADLLSRWLPADLSLKGTKESVEAKLDQSEVPAERLEAINTEYPLLTTDMHVNVDGLL
jgi:hypothetical protein